ncbi:MAG: hypothetical protein GXP45_05615 [bacterium]|nr:hypothetical protein [bacterium]
MTDIEKRIAQLPQEESFQATEKILQKLQKQIEEQNQPNKDQQEKIQNILGNLESLKNNEKQEYSQHIDTLYKELLSLTSSEKLDLKSEEIDSITQLTDIL